MQPFPDIHTRVVPEDPQRVAAEKSLAAATLSL